MTVYRGQIVQLGFRLDTAGAVPDGESSLGWWIDDLSVQEVTVTPPTETPTEEITAKLLPTETSTETPLPTVTPTEEPTPTPLPTATPTEVPTATSTEVPTATPEPPQVPAITPDSD